MEWVNCGGEELPSRAGIECVVLKDSVFVKCELHKTAELFVAYISDLNYWMRLPSILPTYKCALTTYHSQLVLVGGIEISTRRRTNKLWTSDNGLFWQELLPPMPIPCSSPSVINTAASPEYLVVANCTKDRKPTAKLEEEDEGSITIVMTTLEILIEKQWAIVELGEVSLVSCILHNGNLYLNCSESIYHCDVNLLMATFTQPSADQPPTTLWSKIETVVPGLLTSFGQQLIALGGFDIRAYSLIAQSWIHVSKVPGVKNVYSSALLPTGDLLMFAKSEGSNTVVIRASLKGELKLRDDRGFISKYW